MLRHVINYTVDDKTYMSENVHGFVDFLQITQVFPTDFECQYI